MTRYLPLLLILAGCGGSGSNPTEPPPDPHVFKGGVLEGRCWNGPADPLGVGCTLTIGQDGTGTYLEANGTGHLPLRFDFQRTRIIEAGAMRDLAVDVAWNGSSWTMQRQGWLVVAGR